MDQEERPDRSNGIDRMRNLLAFVLVGAFVAGGGAMFHFVIPETNKDIITYMVGQLSGMVTTALAVYFVSKAGQETIDAKRVETTAKMADAITAAAQATPNNDSGAIRPGDEVTLNKEPNP